MATNQSHSGSGDNIGGNKIFNISVPKALTLGLLLVLAICAFIYWRSVSERFVFNQDKIDVTLSVIDSLQIRGLNEAESEVYAAKDLVYYDMRYSGDTLMVFPNAAYLSKLKEDAVLGEAVSLYMLMPKINFKVTNNSNKTIFFSKLVLNVESSRIDPVPIPVFFAEECYEGFSSANYYKTFKSGAASYNYEQLPVAIYNEAWSPMKNVKLEFNIGDRVPDGTFKDLPFSATLKQIDEEAYIDIFPFLRQQGLNIDKIISTSKIVADDPYTHSYADDAELLHGGLGKYHLTGNNSLSVHVYGYMSYEDVEGKTYRHRFSVPLNILRTWGCGAFGMETSVYDIALCPSGSGYEINYPVSNYVKTTEVDNFSIRLCCPKSAVHKIAVKLYYAEDKFVQKYINYHLIVPRSMVKGEVLRFKGNGKCVQ